jgi:oligosaccharide repeat unit polymerase
MPALSELLGSSWIPDFALWAGAGYFRATRGSWFSPAAFLGLYWSAFLTASLLAMDHPVPGLGIWALVSLIMAAQMGSVIAESESARPGATGPEAREAIRLGLGAACLVLFLAAILGCAYYFWASLDLFGQTLTVASVIQMAAKWTLLRYAEFSDPWPLRLAAIWMYPAALIGGIYSSVSVRLRDGLLGAATLLPALLFTFLAGGRTAFLLALALWLGGRWSCSAAWQYRPSQMFGKKKVLALVSLAAGLLLMFGAVNAFRGVGETSNPADLVLEFNSGQVRNYMFGSPAAFAGWFNRGENGPLGWGAFTFPGVFDLLGIRAKTLGTYTESERTVGGESTNIYTMFRGLIEDFTFPGALLICAVGGMCGGQAYARRSLDAQPSLTLASFYTVALFSPLLCPFSFNSTIFACLVTAIVLRKLPTRIPQAIGTPHPGMQQMETE